MVEGWRRQCMQADVRLLSFVDDRYIVSECPEQLAASWELSEAWHRSALWELNVKKSALVQSGGGTCQLEHEGHPLPKADALSALGTQTPTRANLGCPLHEKRLQAAQEMVQRLDVLQLSPYHVQRLLGIIIMPKISYMVLPRLPTLSSLRRVTICIKRALNLYRRRASWPANCALIGTPHRQDPLTHCLFQQVKAVCQARRDSPSVETAWQKIASWLLPTQD